MNLLSETATIDRIRSLETELSHLRVEAYVRAGLPMPAKHERIARLVETAARMFRTSTGSILGPTRAAEVVRARFAVMWVAKQVYGFSTPMMGRELGGRDHTTVMSGLKRAEQLRDKDQDYRAATDGLVAMFTPKQEEEAVDATSH